MRSMKLDLDSVVAKFEGWRQTKSHREPIPAGLWKAAFALLDRYAVTEVCRRLRLNQTRFNQAREALAGAARHPRQHGRLGRPARASRLESIARQQAGRQPSGGAFVELPRLGMSGVMAPAGHELPRYRLVLESATGTVTVVTTAPSHGLVDAVCRFVLGSLEAGSRV
jgi:hypothetical protein